MVNHKNKNRSASDVITYIIGIIATTFIIIAVFYPIGSAIKKSFFSKSNNEIYWFFYIASVILSCRVLQLINALSSKIKIKIDECKLKNTKCIHSIKGGETLGLCSKCKYDRERLQREYESNVENEVLRRAVKQRVIKLRNEEIVRFTKVNLSSKEFLYKVSPNEFENVVAEMYKRQGYNVKQTPYSNDKGKDIILMRDGKKYLVECKKYDFTNTIGREALQKFFAAIIEERAEKGFFITTSDYKSTAIQYAKDIKLIELINGTKLILMMRDTYPEDYNSNLVKIMCGECGEIVEFVFRGHELTKFCNNGHSVNNDFDCEILSPQYLSNNKYCIKCEKPMKLVYWKGKHFWGCSDYPRCGSYQRFNTV